MVLHLFQNGFPAEKKKHLRGRNRIVPPDEGVQQSELAYLERPPGSAGASVEV